MSRIHPGMLVVFLFFGVLHVGFGPIFTQNVALAGNTAAQAAPRRGNWTKRHKEMNERLAEGNVDLIFFGDSITQSWGSKGKGKEVWDEYYADRNAVHFGISGDRTQNLLWRIEHSDFQKVSPKLVVLLIGTNNLPPRNTPEETIEGVTKVVEKLREKLPKTKILLMSLCRAHDPNDPGRKAADQVNLATQKLDDGENVLYVDLTKKFVGKDGSISKKILRDDVHPTKKGYVLWAETIEPYVEKYVGKKKK